MAFTAEQMAGFTVIMGIGFLASIGANIVSIVKNFRRNPPIDQELHLFARKDELKSAIDMAEVSYARKAEFDVFRHEIQRSCRDNHKRVDDTLKDVFDIQRALTKEITDRLDSNFSKIAEWQRGIERQIGNLESRNRG